jgi:chromosome segregation ATPase
MGSSRQSKATAEEQQQHAAASSDQECSGAESTTAALQGVHAAMQEELEQLRSSYLLLQEEYWRQKERLMGLDLDMAKLQAAADDAIAKAAQVHGMGT